MRRRLMSGARAAIARTIDHIAAERLQPHGYERGA
jgi:hypothetical protein